MHSIEFDRRQEAGNTIVVAKEVLVTMFKQTRHGNRAKVDPSKDVVPQYITYPVTNFKDAQPKNEAPLISDDDVERAKKFVDQNHK